MGNHTRSAVRRGDTMRIILEAPADSPASTQEIIDALGRWPLRVCWVLSRLELLGWVTSEMTVRGRVYRPSYDAHWYKRRVTRREAGTNA